MGFGPFSCEVASDSEEAGEPSIYYTDALMQKLKFSDRRCCTLNAARAAAAFAPERAESSLMKVTETSPDLIVC
jgi:hypothetical protein